MTVFLIMTAVVIFLIGLSKGGLGGAMGALSTPLMALVMPADQDIGLLLPILIIADVFAVTSHWQRWNPRLVLLLVPGAIGGIALGTLFITAISPDALRQGLGIIALLFVAYKLLEPRLRRGRQYTARNWHGLLAGGGAGFASSLAHTGGPPITIYLLLQNLSPRMFVATSALFFAVINWIKVPTYYYADLFDFQLLGQVVWLLPLLPLSVWLGRLLAERINKQLFDRLIILLLGVSAILLLSR